MQLRSAFTISLTLLVLQSQLRAAPAQDASPEQPGFVTVVELFTSEGCSTCPPADTLLQQIHLKSVGGQLIVGISEHVTYWNSQGWKDPYSAQAFTDRQSAYASRLSTEGPYTPQMVVNGREQFVGSNAAALKKALEEDAHRKHPDLRILSAAQDADGLNIKFSLAGATSKTLDILAVLTDDADHSNVLRGENSGKSLQHVSVARSLTRVASLKGDAEQTVHLVLPQGFQPGSGAGHHLVLLAQEQHQGLIQAAATAAI